MATRTVCRVNRVYGMDVCKDVVNGAGRRSVAESSFEITRKSRSGLARIAKAADSEAAA